MDNNTPHKQNQCLSVPNDSINAIETKRKVNTGLLRGVSDLILVMPGKLLFLEVKTDTCYQSEAQREFQQRIEDLGFSYHVVRSVEDVEVLIQQAKQIVDDIISEKK